MSQPFVQIHDINMQYQQQQVLTQLYWNINKGENWALRGISGSGKTTLAKLIAGLQRPQHGQIDISYNYASTLPPKTLFVDSWYQFKNVEGIANFYYQQRYTSLQAKETITVKAELAHFAQEEQLEMADVKPVLAGLGYAELLDTQLLQLSSGEHKKLQLVKALWLKPQLLIIDQPFTGLDAMSRKNLNSLLDEIAEQGVQLILICNDAELPVCINKFAEIKSGKIEEIDAEELVHQHPDIFLHEIPAFLQHRPDYTSEEIVRMKDVNISYGEKKVLRGIDWEVKAGDKWLLQGPNGSGKSTLLSLINGDHPQSYANHLYLFGKRRGSGESIWDIKQKIGLISPEFHWYFDKSATVWESIASGLYDSVGLFRQLPYSRKILVDELVNYFGFTEDKNRLLTALPLGKQRLALLARTVIKNPQLLILDEPCQGLDQQQTRYFNRFVDELCNNGMTIIYVGHYEGELPETLTRKLVLKNGSIEKEETLSREGKLANWEG